MRIQYSVTEQDLVAFHEHFILTSGTVSFWRSAVARLLGLMVVVFVGTAFAHASLSAALASAVTVAAVFLTVWRLTYRTELRRNLAKSLTRLYGEGGHRDGVLGEHSLDVSPDGLVERTEFSEARQKWEGIPHVDVTPERVFLYTTASAAFVVPRSAVSDLPGLLALIEEHVGAARIRRFDAKAA
jgi:hypothetical protein